jgi:K+-transporting ATPase ATPase A chain
VFLVVVTLLVRPLGGYMARVFAGERTVLDPALRPLERLIFRVSGVDARREMAWPEYATSFVLLTLAGHFARQGIRPRSLGTLPTDRGAPPPVRLELTLRKP